MRLPEALGGAEPPHLVPYRSIARGFSSETPMQVTSLIALKFITRWAMHSKMGAIAKQSPSLGVSY